MVKCQTCDGKGKIKITLPVAMDAPCIFCGGTGVEPKKKEKEPLFKGILHNFFNRNKGK
jgi:DnaJ-class molecular chaperone